MYKILKTFLGSQDGVTNTRFEAGSTVELSDYLVSCADPSFIQEVTQHEIQNKAISTSGQTKKGRK